jgi:hypothetical protein
VVADGQRKKSLAPAEPILHQRLQARTDERTVAARMSAKARPFGNVVLDSRPVARVEDRERQPTCRARSSLAANDGRHAKIPQG